MFFTPADDFDLEKIAKSGQCFRWEKIGEGYRIIYLDKSLIIYERENNFELLTDEEEFNAVWKNYFDLGTNYSEIRKKIDESDEFLKQAASEQKGIRILRQDPFEMLISFIISQNRNIPAIEKSIYLLSKYCGEEKKDARGEIFYAFPKAENIASASDDILAECKLGYRVPYVKRAAKSFLNGEIDFEKLKNISADDSIKELQKIYGVGLKVASCIALFGLHNLNAFPIDVWMKRILAEFYSGGYPYEKYSPYNGVYQQYMFAYYRKSAGKAN
ncbi:MAG: DNA-3-methyladenine glycosylase 2 family protein [Selenomonadaceae bacterium]|nr:DNA-3-methyladenine glycosylase 2 family protein [Selenomonadaceae bacterium]